MRKRKVKLTYFVVLEDNSVKVLINGLANICIKQDEFISYRSYKFSHDSYFIEFILRDTTVLCEYDSVDKWIGILTVLNKTKLFA